MSVHTRETAQTKCYTTFQVDKRGCCDKRFRRSESGLPLADVDNLGETERGVREDGTERKKRKESRSWGEAELVVKVKSRNSSK
jgi:hypothetical protein